MNRSFIESSLFRKQVEGHGLYLLRRIQLEILKNPEVGDIIVGTAGVRKMRVAGFGKGKSGGFRVLYLDLERIKVCHLLLIFAKGEMDNISAEDKKLIRQLVENIKSRSRK